MTKKNALPIEWVTKIFMRLHGRFGNTFFDKYRIGTLNENGQDMGIENAKIVWSEELAGVTGQRVSAALSSKYDYAPSCDDFLKNCVVKAEINDFKALPKPAVDQEIVKENIEKMNELAGGLKQKSNKRDWVKRILANPQNFPDIAQKMAREVEHMAEA